MSKFYETDSESRWWAGIIGRTVLGLLVLAVLAVVVGGFTLGYRYLFASSSGKVQKTEIINSGANQLTQQAAFETLFADIKRYDVQLNQAAASNDPHKDTIVLGLENQCADAVAKYDALARTERAEAFRAADLPAQIDVTDPATDCKENK